MNNPIEAGVVTITIAVTIDTDGVISKYPQLSKDPTVPTRIEQGLGCMVVAGEVEGSGNGSEEIRVAAHANDRVRVFAKSGSNNFEDAVLMYGMPMVNGDQVFLHGKSFNYRDCVRSAVMPCATMSPLPAKIEAVDFWFHEDRIKAPGTERRELQFALYTRDGETGVPVLFGYCAWELTIVVPG